MVLFIIVGQVTCPLHSGPLVLLLRDARLLVHISVVQSTPLLLFLLLELRGYPVKSVLCNVIGRLIEHSLLDNQPS